MPTMPDEVGRNAVLAAARTVPPIKHSRLCPCWARKAPVERCDCWVVSGRRVGNAARAAAEVAYAAGRADERAGCVVACSSAEVRERLYAAFSDDLRARISRNTLYAVLATLGDLVERGEHLDD